MTDQHRADALGFMGNQTVTTPALDALAAAGVVFDNAFVQCPVCMESVVEREVARPQGLMTPSAANVCSASWTIWRILSSPFPTSSQHSSCGPNDGS